MKLTALAGIILYGVLSISAGTFDLIAGRKMQLWVNLLLIASGIVMFVAAYMVAKEKRFSVQLLLVAIILPWGYAIYNQRIEGFGHPSHHLVRALFSVAVFSLYYFHLKKKKTL